MEGLELTLEQYLVQNYVAGGERSILDFVCGSGRDTKLFMEQPKIKWKYSNNGTGF